MGYREWLLAASLLIAFSSAVFYSGRLEERVSDLQRDMTSLTAQVQKNERLLIQHMAATQPPATLSNGSPADAAGH